MTDEIKNKELSPHEAAIRNMKLIDDIAASMREIPYLSSDPQLSSDVNALKKVEVRPTGGIYTYMEGHEHPYKGFPHHSFVDRIDFIKKIVRAVLSGMYHATKDKSKVWFLTLLPLLWVSKIIFRVGVYVFFRHIDRVKIRPEFYCDAVRELYRCFSIFIDGENQKRIELRTQLRDLVCMILEFDNAYRYRFQDIIIELNKDDFSVNQEKEIVRLIALMSSRERVQDVNDTWFLIERFIKLYFKIDKDFTTIIKSVLLNIDLDKVALSVEDKEFCKPRKDYQFGFDYTA